MFTIPAASLDVLLILVNQGPVVQSVVSLTKSLVEDLLSPIILKKSIAVRFFAEKL